MCLILEYFISYEQKIFLEFLLKVINREAFEYFAIVSSLVHFFPVLNFPIGLYFIK